MVELSTSVCVDRTLTQVIWRTRRRNSALAYYPD